MLDSPPCKPRRYGSGQLLVIEDLDRGAAFDDGLKSPYSDRVEHHPSLVLEQYPEPGYAIGASGPFLGEAIEQVKLERLHASQVPQLATGAALKLRERRLILEAIEV